MSSTFDANAHHHKMTLLQNYIARENLVNDLSWEPSIGGHTVHDLSDDEAFMGIIVGKVSEHKLRVGTTGNYLGEGYGSLPKAKYQLFLTRPITSPFKADFNRAYSLLSHLQDIAAVSQKKRDMLVIEGGSKMIRFTQNIFKERVSCISICYQLLTSPVIRIRLCLTLHVPINRTLYISKTLMVLVSCPLTISFHPMFNVHR